MSVWEAEGSGSGSCPVTGFYIRADELLGYATTVLVSWSFSDICSNCGGFYEVKYRK
jgi:hypothetical protein